MNDNLSQAQQAIQNARIALRDGDRNAARRWAEQAAHLAPQLEDPWLILASVAAPQASVKYIERALQINPDSPRARKGMEWAMRRLQQVPAGQGNAPKREQAAGVAQDATKAATGRAATTKPRRLSLFPILLVLIGCVVFAFAAWTASTNPALASILSGASQPTAAVHPKVWAQVAIAKPSYTPVPVAAVATATIAQLHLPTATATLPPTEEPSLAPTSEPESSPTPEPAATTEAVSTPGVLDMTVLDDTPTPTALPTSASAATQIAKKPENPPVGNGERWIEVDLSEQRVYAWEGTVLVNEFIVSTGTWQTPTVTGTFKIWNKTRIQAMSGPGYYLPNVPFVMYFYKDYGFHGTYWHNNFGTPMSHGCVNLTIPDSEWLYNWASVGTVVKVHD